MSLRPTRGCRGLPWSRLAKPSPLVRRLLRLSQVGVHPIQCPDPSRSAPIRPDIQYSFPLAAPAPPRRVSAAGTSRNANSPVSQTRPCDEELGDSQWLRSL